MGLLSIGKCTKNGDKPLGVYRASFAKNVKKRPFSAPKGEKIPPGADDKRHLFYYFMLAKNISCQDNNGNLPEKMAFI
jgi:hypothetical protein